MGVREKYSSGEMSCPTHAHRRIQQSGVYCCRETGKIPEG